MRGILLVNKRQGWTSFDAVNFCKRVFGTREVGHLGTLDPMATGVLAVTVGSATKLFDMFLNKAKTYIAEFTFGYSTDTLDAEGQIEDKCDTIPTLEQIEAVLPEFQGEIEQMPPKYSAKKIGGKKAYDLAREGKEFELKPNKVTIHNLKILDYNKGILKIEIECGAGTYIRSLGRDIATSLNTLATMTSLVRTKLGTWNIEDCIDIKDNINEFIQSKLLPIDSVFSNLSTLDDVQIVSRLLNGQTVITDLTDGDYRLYKDNEFVAIATSKDKHIKMSKYFKCGAHTK